VADIAEVGKRQRLREARTKEPLGEDMLRCSLSPSDVGGAVVMAMAAVVATVAASILVELAMPIFAELCASDTA
jgi:hypothetical protein